MTDPELLYPLWRFHLWRVGFGSYSEIEAAVENGRLQVFTCTDSDCDCNWTKIDTRHPRRSERGE